MLFPRLNPEFWLALKFLWVKSIVQPLYMQSTIYDSRTIQNPQNRKIGKERRSDMIILVQADQNNIDDLVME